MISLSMILFMLFFGLSYGGIIYLYVPEIVEAKYLPYSSMANLGGAAFCIIVFPLLEDVFPNPGYLFLIFFCYTILSLFINQKFMVETKDKPREKIFEEYNQMKICGR